MKDPEYAKAYRLRRQRETLFSSPGRDRYMETQRRHNANPERQEKKREAARAAYYEAHPERPAPVCATCSLAIEWTAKPGGRAGRPPKYHQTPECNPYHTPRKKGDKTSMNQEKPPTRDQARAAIVTLRCILLGYAGHLKDGRANWLELAVLALNEFLGTERVSREYGIPKRKDFRARPAHTRTRAALATLRRLTATQPQLWPYGSLGREAAHKAPETLEELLKLEDLTGQEGHAPASGGREWG